MCVVGVMAHDINCPHCGYGYDADELLNDDDCIKIGEFKVNCKQMCKKDFIIEAHSSINYWERKE